MDLESKEFPVRDKASRELQALGRMIEPALRRALEKNPPQEARRRLEQLLSEACVGPVVGESLRMTRAITVLEYAATREAEELLEALARGVDDSWMTVEARKAVERIRIQSRAR